MWKIIKTLFSFCSVNTVQGPIRIWNTGLNTKTHTFLKLFCVLIGVFMLRFYDNSPTWLAGVWSRGGWGCRAIPRGRRGWAAGHEQRPGGTPALGWSDLEFVFYTFHVVPNCCRAQIPKLHVWMLHFNLSENFDCYTKISTQKNMLIKLATERDVFFEFFKS